MDDAQESPCHTVEKLVLGLISGTSADAIDAALVAIGEDGARRAVRVVAAGACPFPAGLREELFALLPPHSGSVESLAVLDARVGEAFAGAALTLLEGAGVTPATVDLIGSHGQTVLHQIQPPGAGSGKPAVTVQVGSGAIIAARTGITTVYDFRVADLAAGGEGAPLVPYADYCLFGNERTLAIQNLGGIGNVTVIPAGAGPEAVFAFDTGPANMVIDGLAELLTGGAQRFDRDGALAASGRVSDALVAATMRHPFFARQPPKSTGREEFGGDFVARFLASGRELGLRDADLIASATALTARSLAHAYRDFIEPRARLDAMVLGGGGARNPVLRSMIAREFAPLPVLTHEDFGYPGDAKEAIAFALLAYETARGRPGALPGATGARYAAVLGAVAPGRGFRLW